MLAELWGRYQPADTDRAFPPQLTPVEAAARRDSPGCRDGNRRSAGGVRIITLIESYLRADRIVSAR